MDDCCQSKETELKELRKSHGSVLLWALIINFSMFLVEIISGWFAHSSALTADSLDMLGDAFVYGMSLYAIDRGQKWIGRVSFAKGLIMLVLGLSIFTQCIWRFFHAETPNAETMGIVSALALIANLVCAALLLRHRNDNLNMRSTWLCSRNDVLTNLGTLIAAVIVSLTGARYADIGVGAVVTVLVLRSSCQILSESVTAMRA